MTDTNTAEREAFEKWVVTEFPSIDLTREDDGYYKSLADEWWTAFKAGRASLAASAGIEPVAWPKDAADVRAFIGSQFERLQYGKENGVPHENDRYTLTSHDLLSAFRWWSENLPSPPEGMAGWKLVPIEPTVDQEWEGKEASRRVDSMAEACKIYKAMIAAAPPLPASEAKEL